MLSGLFEFYTGLAVQIIKYYGVVFFCFELVENVLNNTVFIHEECLAMNAIILFTHKLFRSPHTKSVGNGVVFIRKQRKV